MRYVESTWRIGAVVALTASLSGCASLTAMLQAFRNAFSSHPTPATASAAAPKPVEAPVSPAVQHAFADAAGALRAGRNADAERGFRALVQSNPELGGPHANLGVIDRQAGKLAESATELEQAVRLNPKQPLYLNQLGITYRRQGQFVKARDAYQKAITLDPSYAAPYLNLGILNDMYLGDGKRALELYDRYLALTPNDATVTKWIAELKNRKPGPITVSRVEQP
ncbi:MAG: tetratricopeptide repeat protein [Caldimonas sp.]